MGKPIIENKWVLFLAIGFLIMMNVAEVKAAETIAANVSLPAFEPTSCSPTNFRGNSFTVTATGSVQKIQLWFNFTTAHNVSVMIQNNTANQKIPNGQNVSIGSFTSNSTSGQIRLFNITMNTATLTKGKNYSYFVWCPDSTNAEGPLLNTTTGFYPAGNFIQTNNGGATWSNDTQVIPFWIYYNDVSTVSVSITNPTTNTYELNGSVFTVNYSIINAQGASLNNISLTLINLLTGASSSSIKTIGSSALSSNGSINITINTQGVFNYSLTVYHNISGSNFQANSATKTAFNSIIIRIVDSLGVLINGITTRINNALYNSNPLIISTSGLGLVAGQGNITINATSSDNRYSANQTTIIINTTQSVQYSVVMNNYNLELYFAKNGQPYNVTGYITDLNYSITFVNKSFIRDQGNFSRSLVYARFLNSILNSTINITWEDKVQFYEYDNAEAQGVNETIEIFDIIDTSSYFRTLDNSGNAIGGATIRLYATIPNNISGGTSNYRLYGQRITDANGRTVFAFDAQSELVLVVTKEGYEAETVRVTASEVSTFTSDNPHIIRMRKSSLTNVEGIFVSGLYKLDGDFIYESDFNDASKNYYLFVYDNRLRTITYKTNYENINRSVTISSATRSGTIELQSGQSFSNANSSFMLYVYANDEEAYAINVSFVSDQKTVLFDNDVLNGLQGSRAWRAAVFFVLVALSCVIGVIIKTGNDDVGLHTYMMGSIVMPVIAEGTLWMSVTGGFFYLSKLIRTWISE